MIRQGVIAKVAGRFRRDSSGHFAMMTAVTAPVAIALAALAVDAGSLRLEKRQAQALADLAAITAAANIDNAAQAALVTLADNGVANVVLATVQSDDDPDSGGNSSAGDQIVVVTGNYEPTGQDVETRFTTGSGAPDNAVKVTYRTKGTRYFAGALIPPPDIVVTATASASTAAAFSVGSRLAALDGGLVNALLGGLLGSNLSLSVMDYNALLAADVSLLSFLDALAVDLDLTAGTYTQVLDTELTVGRMARTLSKMDGLGGTAKAAAGKLAFQTGANEPKFRLSQLIGLGDGVEVARASIEQIGADINVMELLSLSAIAAGKGRQVALNLGAGVPGLLAARVDLAVGEPPQPTQWFRIGTGGELVRTAQTRLALTAEIGGLLGVGIRVPLYLELAFAEARLRSVTCPSGPDSVRVTVDARPGIANLYLAEVDPSKIGGFANPVPRSPARLLQVPLLVSVTGQAHAEIANMQPRSLTFTASDIDSGKVRQVSTQQIVGSLTQSLLSSVAIDVNVIGLGLGLPGNLKGTVAQLLGAAAPALDSLLNNLLGTLGLALGQADIRVHGASCGRAVLVQ